MNRHFLNIGIVTISLILAGCGTSINIQSDYDREATFTNFESYGWIDSPNPYDDRGALGFDSDIMARRIERMVHAEFDSLGFSYKESYEPSDSNSVQPDFEVSYRMLATEEVEEVRSARPIGHHSPHRHGRHGGHGGHGSYGGGYNRSNNTRQIVECVFMLDIWNTETDRLVWRGWARWKMGENPEPEDVTKQLNRAVGKILSQFPPNKVQKTSS